MLTLLQTINSLNNAILLSKTQIKITKFNNLTLKVLLTLQRLNYIDSFLLNNVHTQCTIFLSKKQNTVFFQQIQSVSTPHKFIYITYSDLVKLKTFDCSGEYLISSTHNKIIMTSDEAIRFSSFKIKFLKCFI